MISGPAFPAARMEDLIELMDFLTTACQDAAVPDDAAFAVQLAVEEAFTNIIQHGYAAAPGPIRCGLQVDADQIAVTIVDEAPPFSPLSAPPPDLESGWEARLEGGLGWHLVQQLMDEVRHEPAPGRGNILTLIKRLGHSTPRTEGESA